jgi:hypothetical protein
VLYRRRWDFFVRNLMDAALPAGYRLAEIPSASPAWAEAMASGHD